MGYSVDKKLLIEAWKRFRPVEKQMVAEEANVAQNSVRKQSKSIKEIFGTKFTHFLMGNTNLVLYNFNESESQI